MFLRIWLTLVSAFAAYTTYLYFNCDNKHLSSPSIEIQQGQNLWQAQNCQACHQLYGLGGYMGPDLTNTISTRGSKYVETYIRYGTGRMPNLHLADSEIKSIIAFLSWVDSSGKSKVPANNVHWTGTYIIK
ncbi:MAG: cytochrome c [Bacteroidetes bacterium]|nr:cytochrome c [Bacteroidota bacterium]